MAIKRGKEIAIEKIIKEENILKEIINSYGKESLSEHKDKLCKLQLELECLCENKARGTFVSSRQKWLEEGAKNTKYFLDFRKNKCKPYLIS